MNRWKILPVPDVGKGYDEHFRAIRLNSLGSLFWFAKDVLAKNRLRKLHKELARSLETDELRLVLEVPMGMFKSTLALALAIWWALPFSNDDEKEMEKLGFGKSWIRYMRREHNQNTRNLIAHEIDKRAVDMGKDIDFTYKSNDLFRELFPTILPDRNCQWNDHSKYQKRTKDLPIDSTNPTFSFCGVGHALQGVRADNTIEDDLFGRAAQESMLKRDGSIGESTIRWHRQLTTRLDSIKDENRILRQLVSGNRWGHADLNSWIKKKQPQFTFETHDAEGGCCKLHPEHGVPIFPEEFSMDVLEQKKLDNTPYDYMHFYRNKSVMPEEQILKEEWLRKFVYKPSRPDLPEHDIRNFLLIEHKVYDGIVLEDFQPGVLDVTIIVDPLHKKKNKRSKHVIWSIGLEPESSRIYLLNLWAKDTVYSNVVEEMYQEYKRWSGSYKQPTVYMGEIAHELLAFYLDKRDRLETKFRIEVELFTDDDSLAGMKNRIEGMEPIFKTRTVWNHTSQDEFTEAFANYPACELDTLEVLGHYPLLVDWSSSKAAREFSDMQDDAFANRDSGPSGY